MELLQLQRSSRVGFLVAGIAAIIFSASAAAFIWSYRANSEILLISGMICGVSMLSAWWWSSRIGFWAAGIAAIIFFASFGLATFFFLFDLRACARNRCVHSRMRRDRRWSRHFERLCGRVFCAVKPRPDAPFCQTFRIYFRASFSELWGPDGPRLAASNCFNPPAAAPKLRQNNGP